MASECSHCWLPGTKVIGVTCGRVREFLAQEDSEMSDAKGPSEAEEVG